MSGAELDLPSLHEIMKHHGGMENVMEKNKWAKVMEALKLPKVVSFYIYNLKNYVVAIITLVIHGQSFSILCNPTTIYFPVEPDSFLVIVQRTHQNISI